MKLRSQQRCCDVTSEAPQWSQSVLRSNKGTHWPTHASEPSILMP